MSTKSPIYVGVRVKVLVTLVNKTRAPRGWVPRRHACFGNRRRRVRFSYPRLYVQKCLCASTSLQWLQPIHRRRFAVAVVAITTTNTTTSSYHRVVCVVIWIIEPSYTVGNRLLQRVKLRPLSCLVMAPTLQVGLGEFDPHRG